MAFTINGIGTTFYGQSDWHPDASFCTTEWFVVAYLPIFPTKSLRVARNLKADVNAVVYQSEGYYVLEALKTNWAQVMRTYAFAALYLLFVGTLAWLFFGKWSALDRSTLPAISLLMLFVLLLVVPFFGINLWRAKAFQRVLAASRSAQAHPSAGP